MKSEVIVTEQQLPAEVVRAIKKGKKIEAIQILREKTGLGLANAKVLVDRASTRIGPPRVMLSMVDIQSGTGKFTKSLLLVILLAALYYFTVGI